ncbi:hypothetical protein QQM39_16325 [Streptomyces sp. DT2A-34]|uniref:hypothetical protein n=1 Tax=Streptomyces sp. DT2A-34 TaxID=3051182 RepID=UPI00265BA44F|nr:hypothetical protein [Streptomyces sp. DT2A-34]MDO0912355.1 hypothetical protein [Streptomyces sp. DT2A-34]
MTSIRKTALGAITSALLLAGSAAPALAAPSAPQAAPGEGWVRVAASGDFTAQGTWSKSTTWGQSAGTITSTSASGWVKDLDDDGDCAQVVINWYGSGGKSDTDYSPKACPQGDKDYFSKAPGDSTNWTATGYEVWMRKA